MWWIELRGTKIKIKFLEEKFVSFLELDISCLLDKEIRYFASSCYSSELATKDYYSVITVVQKYYACVLDLF